MGPRYVPMAPTALCYDELSPSNYDLASAPYRDTLNVASWVDNTRHAPRHDEGAYQLGSMNMLAQTGCSQLDASTVAMPTSTGMEMSFTQTGYAQSGDMFYSPGQTYADLASSHAYSHLPAEWGNYGGDMYCDPSNASFLNPMDSLPYSDYNSPPLTIATTVSNRSSGSSGPASATVDDLMLAQLNFDDSGLGLPSPAMDHESIPQEYEYLGESTFKMYR